MRLFHRLTGPRSSISLGMLANAGWTLSAQLFPVILLQPAEYGAYSIVYLVYAFGTSVLLSAVLEATARRAKEHGIAADATRAVEAVTQISLVFGIAAGCVLYSVNGSWPGAALAALGVFSSLYRGAVRYMDTAAGRHTLGLRVDLVAILTTILVWVAALAWMRIDVHTALLAWAVSSAVACALSTFPRIGSGRTLVIWWRTHRREIRTLLGESLLMDLGAYGTPAILAGILMPHAFGTYRAVSTVAAPVRLILNPLRPFLSMPTKVGLTSAKAILISAGCALVIGAGATASLLFMSSRNLDAGALTALTSFALPVGIYVGANFFGHYWYLIARTRSSAAQILSRRYLQTVILLGLPIGGAVTAGLSGAIWFSAIGTVVSSMGWLTLRVGRSSATRVPEGTRRSRAPISDPAKGNLA